MKKKLVKKGYTCGVAWQHELDNDYIKIFKSIKDAKKAKPCWDECGIVELEVSLKKWVEPQELVKK